MFLTGSDMLQEGWYSISLRWNCFSRSGMILGYNPMTNAIIPLVNDYFSGTTVSTGNHFIQNLDGYREENCLGLPE